MSTDIRANMNSTALYTFIFGLLEMLRICIWNFHCVEVEHQRNQMKHRVVQQLTLPVKVSEEAMNLNDLLQFDLEKLQ